MAYALIATEVRYDTRTLHQRPVRPVRYRHDFLGGNRAFHGGAAMTGTATKWEIIGTMLAAFMMFGTIVFGGLLLGYQSGGM